MHGLTYTEALGAPSKDSAGVPICAFASEQLPALSKLRDAGEAVGIRVGLLGSL